MTATNSPRATLKSTPRRAPTAFDPQDEGFMEILGAHGGGIIHALQYRRRARTVFTVDSSSRRLIP